MAGCCRTRASTPTTSSDFYDEHSLDLQRAYAITCLMVGNDPERFEEAADYMEMDADRQEGCANDYAQFEVSLSACSAPISARTSRSRSIYDEAGADYDWAEQLAQALEDSGKDRRRISATSFALPNAIAIRATLCGEANAYLRPGQPSRCWCATNCSATISTCIANDLLSDDG